MRGFWDTASDEADEHTPVRPDGGLRPEDAKPSEDAETAGDAAAEQGARRLLIAILHEAVYCYQKYMFTQSQRHRRLFREVQRWFNVQDTGAPLSFEYICQVLRIDPDYFRRGLRKWRSRQSSGRATREGHAVPRREPPMGLHGPGRSQRCSNGATCSEASGEIGDQDPQDH
jgi:hypothetical protein